MNTSEKMSGNSANDTVTNLEGERNGTCNKTEKTRIRSPPKTIPLRLAAIKEYKEDDEAESGNEEDASLPPSDTETLCGDDDTNDGYSEQKQSPTEHETNDTPEINKNSESASSAA